MAYHPHIHCIVPGGGLTLSKKWKEANGQGKFLFPVKGLSNVFKSKLIEVIKNFIETEHIDDTQALIDNLYKTNWVVYAKPYIQSQPNKQGNLSLIRYLARYTHNIAISHHRIVEYDSSTVTFSFKDYRHGNQKKVMNLSAWEFIRRFILHILPKGFVRIRHYGILSSSYKSSLFPNADTQTTTDWTTIWKEKGLDISACPNCKKGKLILIRKIVPARGPPRFSHV